MRPPIPIEEHQEVFELLAEALPGLDKVLVEELATDYLLEALVCIDPWDFNHVLIRPGPFVTGAATVASVDDLPAQAEQLMDDLLAARSTKLPPSGMLLVVTSPPTLRFRRFSEIFSRLKAKLPEGSEPLGGFFLDRENSKAKVRICLSGEAISTFRATV